MSITKRNNATKPAVKDHSGAKEQNGETGNKERVSAHDLFSLFTANVIKDKVSFPR